ncbi:type II CAAX prenyl endopeptidase Rce1 family protein [Aestuariivivens sediminicola]|uniref:CPBP family glutamic-type intramembrane protease n=1 Tax=Aestuariivivens sediminicola TaxID=2913560 RepID=UPI001F5A060D|nr:CPBP family glutamic-type intramembrane protease [Aestuariivivens sediminicola]
MNSTRYKIIEFLVIFMAFPIGLAFNYPIWIKLSIGLLGLIYIGFVLTKHEGIALKRNKALDWKWFWKQTMIKFTIIAILTTLLVWLTNKTALFNVVMTKPYLWVIILFIYTLFSVYPQEIVYRTFFFKRYLSHISDKRLFIVLNAAVFSVGHVFFKNGWVLLLTFLGGLLFAITYSKTRSTILVSLEHAIYGCWLFTVGMGEMLGFPQ